MKPLITAIFLGSILTGSAATLPTDTLTIEQFRYWGPFAVTRPAIIDSLDVNSKAFDEKSLLDLPLGTPAQSATSITGTNAPGASDGDALHIVEFTVENTGFVEPQLIVEGLASYNAYLDGKKVDSPKLQLNPATHRITVKYLSTPGRPDTLNIALAAPAGSLTQRTDGHRLFTLDDVLHGTVIAGTSISPSGRYLIESTSTTRRGGGSAYAQRVIDTTTGRVVARRNEGIAWMPQSERFYYMRQGVDSRELVTVDPATGAEEVLASNLPEGYPVISPDEKSLIFTVYTEGPKEDPSIYEVLEPDDRQPGWRRRSSLARYDIATGRLQPLTHGHRNVNLLDISDDGSKLLIMVNHTRLTQRPTTLYTIAMLDVNTLAIDTIAADDGFLVGAQFSPDGSKVLVQGSPDALGGIG